MSKLPNATRESMTTEQQKIWDKIHEGRSGGGGPYSMLMHSPEMAQYFAATEDYFRNESHLPDADRETIILDRRPRSRSPLRLVAPRNSRPKVGCQARSHRSDPRPRADRQASPATPRYWWNSPAP